MNVSETFSRFSKPIVECPGATPNQIQDFLERNNISKGVKVVVPNVKVLESLKDLELSGFGSTIRINPEGVIIKNSISIGSKIDIN
ncbi:MAG: hypothetical protein HN981_00095 [Candidatus Pacebacteria bacterium]|nr:hypothetical protein [Candidatus Paceibacterota bacterium]MBT4652133.1 hypothetical protein [Candidatus Paceibacterota bacterium]MBT6756671.1 hypothetical protein [Candidatus Paceibacterota bacterium]MBT6920784.1 hypothetical protein [Candidatus Paceibacterota bacterium]